MKKIVIWSSILFSIVAFAAIGISSINPLNVLTTGGETLNIFGSGFKNNSVARVDGVDCTNTTKVSSSHLLCTTPALSIAGTVDVEVGKYRRNNWVSQAVLLGALEVDEPTTPGLATLAYACDTAHGTVYFRPDHFGYAGGNAGYLLLAPVGLQGGTYESAQHSTLGCQDPQNGIRTTATRQNCVFYGGPDQYNSFGRWQLFLEFDDYQTAHEEAPDTIVQTIANSYDCDNNSLQPGVSNAECKAQYTCQKQYINIVTGAPIITEDDFNPPQ